MRLTTPALQRARSHPTRDGWIEILHIPPFVNAYSGPIPHGMGGLKFLQGTCSAEAIQSHPTRDGWIEISKPAKKRIASSWSHPTRDGWIEISKNSASGLISTRPIPHGMGGLKCLKPIPYTTEIKSHPTRDGWIEMLPPRV